MILLNFIRMIQHDQSVRFACLVFLCLQFLPAFLSAQGLGMGGSSQIEGKYKFMPVPYVNYDRSMGLSLGAVPLLMFNPSEKDTISPSSLLGGVGFWSTNKTWFLMGFGMFYLGEDRWRITTAGGIGTVYYQFYLGNTIDAWIPYQSEADFAGVATVLEAINESDNVKLLPAWKTGASTSRSVKHFSVKKVTLG